MNKTEIVKSSSASFAKLQSDCGRTATPTFETTCSIGGLERFDSLSGIKATGEFSDQLGIYPSKVHAFAYQGETKVLTISEVAEGVCKRAATKDSPQ